VRLPRLTIAIAVAAIAIALSPALQDALVLDRAAVASGQLWRVATGSFVHFSRTHLAYDLMVVIVAGALLEWNRRPLAGLIALSASAIGISVMLLEPGLVRYGGLSGVAYALVALLSLDALRTSGLTRAAGAATLLLAAGKLCWEWRTGSLLFVADTAATVQAVPLAHLAGACSGALVALFMRPDAPRRQGARAGISSRSWKSKLKSVSGDTACIVARSTVPSGFRANVTYASARSSRSRHRATNVSCCQWTRSPTRLGVCEKRITSLPFSFAIATSPYHASRYVPAYDASGSDGPDIESRFAAAAASIVRAFARSASFIRA
jgi:rhomboid family GlyGly-CTERM serine protease